MEQKNLFVLRQTKAIDTEKIDAPLYSYWSSVFRSFFRKKSNYVALALLAVVLLLSFVQPMLSGFTMSYPNINNPETHFLAPSWEFLFGTTNVGDSLFDYVWAGARTSLSIALIATAINMSVGIIVGAIWGYSKSFDAIMMEIYNIVSNVPFILFIVVFMYIVGPGFWSLIAAMTITGWMGIAYFIRTQVMIIRDREYNLASRCLGTPLPRMVTRNILPYMTSIIVTLISREIPSYISYEVFLSFLGIGISASEPSLGRMIREYMTWYTQYPYLFWIPVAISSILSVTLYVVGQSLADASDPKTHM